MLSQYAEVDLVNEVRGAVLDNKRMSGDPRG